MDMDDERRRRYGTACRQIFTEPHGCFLIIKNRVPPLLIDFDNNATNGLGSYINGGQPTFVHVSTSVLNCICITMHQLPAKEKAELI